MSTKKSLTTFAAVLVSGVLVLAPTAANAEPSASFSAVEATSLTVDDVQAALDIIQEQTSGTDGKFDYDALIEVGVPDVVATEYAGVLEAAGVPYAAPPEKKSDIDAAAKNYEATVQAVAAQAGVAASDFPWDTVLRVAGSFVECMAIRTTLLAYDPLAGCVPNPVATARGL